MRIIEIPEIIANYPIQKTISNDQNIYLDNNFIRMQIKTAIQTKLLLMYEREKANKLLQYLNSVCDVQLAINIIKNDDEIFANTLLSFYANNFSIETTVSYFLYN